MFCDINRHYPDFDWLTYGDFKADHFASTWMDGSVSAYDCDQSINLASLDLPELRHLKEVIYKIDAKIVPRGIKSAINKFIAIQEGKVVRASGAEQMQYLMQNYIALNAERFWLVRKVSGQDRFYLSYRVDFYPKQESRDRYIPASIRIKIKYTRSAKEQDSSIDFVNNECRGKTPEELLREDGYRVATLEECQKHDAEYERYKQYATRVGHQITSVGIGISSKSDKNLGVNGLASILVIDVADDSDEDDSNMHNCEIRHKTLPYLFQTLKAKVKGEIVVDEDDEDYELEEARYVEAPVHPIIKCFDLRRHTHFNLHINDIDSYIYDKELDQKLVIDSEVKELIGLLARSRDGKFKDVVAGKTGGTTVLLAGPPGVGKTLTAEIFSEAVEKPLYRVQCSQLGTDPDELEQKLLKVFRRAARWKAIILLDESDVYVAKRGDCLAKNAIVGVFLRVLEYQESVMFMTTNLPESVDDAIASRCIARIDYSIPTPEDLNKIWDVLSSNAGMELDWTVRSQITNEFPHLSGRDVKNILKLIAARNQPIDLASVKQAAKFHPNRGNWREQGWR